MEHAPSPSYASLMSAALDRQTGTSDPILQSQEVEELARYVEQQLRRTHRE